MYLETTHASFAHTVLDVSASQAGSAQTYNLIHAREGANILFGVRGDGQMTVAGDALIGDDVTADTVTINAVLQGRCGLLPGSVCLRWARV